ncbi:hypothetical protein [Streptomyces sp. NPDC093094]|uniref:hypothetical protein n=1 Tax=Streptomyces sp. NPDC093094 TaxID=3366026 RepID=UPI003806C014
MKHHMGGLAATALCAVVVTVVTGCGPDGTAADEKGASPTGGGTAEPSLPFDAMTAAQIDEEARKAMKDASSMRWTGQLSGDGRQVRVDMATDVDGSCNGTFDGGSTGPVHIIRKGELVHIEAAEDFWRTTFSRGTTAEEAEELVARFEGHWIKPPRSMAKMWGGLCDVFHTRLQALDGASGGTLTRQADTTVDGRPVAVLAERTSTDTTTVYIAKEGRPYPLRITVTGGDEAMDLTFTDHGEPVDTTPPPPEQVLDTSALAPLLPEDGRR